MKSSFTKTKKNILMVWLILSALSVQAQFQRQFGTSLDESFTKVIQSGSNFYVLGSGVTPDGRLPRATVTRLNAAGELQWTLSLGVSSQWKDAVLTPNGELLVVGHSLPDDNTSSAIMGRVSSVGAFAWLRAYDLPNRDGFDRIVLNPVPQNANFPYYVLGHQLQVLPSTDDVFLMNLNADGAINWKKLYQSSADDEFNKDLEALPNGDLILAGNRNTEGLIMRADNTGALFNGATPEIPFTFTDVAQAGSNGFYAVGQVSSQEPVHLMKFDADLLNVWDASFNGLTEAHQVLLLSNNIYVAGRKVREAACRFSENASGPVLNWIKYLDNGLVSQTKSSLSPLQSAQLGYVDGRTVKNGGFGLNCAFISVSDLSLNTCMTETDTAGNYTVTKLNTLFNGPQLPDIQSVELPVATNLSGGLRSWQQGDACQALRTASIIGVKFKECEGRAYSDQTPIANWKIQLLTSEGQLIGEQLTKANGSYAFADLPKGNYIVREVAQPGWTPNVPPTGQLAITLETGEQRTVNFGNCPPPQLFCACPAGGQPAISNQVTNGNFSSGNTGFSSGYTYNNVAPLQPGQYWIGSNPSLINAGFSNCSDHTTGTGNMMVVNGGANVSTPIWCQTFTVVPNSSYLFEARVASLSSTSPANLMLFVNNVSFGAGIFASNKNCNWEQYCLSWESGTNTTVTLCLVDLNAASGGNDFALDDIRFSRCVAPVSEVKGRVYQSCDSLPYSNQALLSGWTIQLLNEKKEIIAEQITNAQGEYRFFDLPHGQYLVKIANLPEPRWTPKIPVSGEYQINLGSQEPVERNFALCPGCSCDSLYVNLEALDSGTDTVYFASFKLRQNDCFDQIELELNSGTFAGAALTLGNLVLEQVATNRIRLTPATGDFINLEQIQLRFSVIGAEDSIQVSTSTQSLKPNYPPCKYRFVLPKPGPPPGKIVCCPANSKVGPELVLQGDFSLGTNATFNTGYPPSAGAVVTGSYAVLNGAQVGGIWNCIGKSGDPNKDYFLAINGDIGPVPYIAWRQQVQVTPGLQYSFSIAANNLTTPNPTYNPYDPNVQIRIVNPITNSIVASNAMVLPEIPDRWEEICLKWTPPQDPGNPNNMYRLEILSLNLDPYGNDFALDCISFRECTPPPPCYCGGFSNMTYRPTQGIMNLSYACGDTLGVVCNQPFKPQIGGFFQCQGSSCPPNDSIQWILYAPSGVPIQSGSILANPGFNFNLLSTWFNQAGIYALSLVGHCGGAVCDTCTLYLESLGCSNSCPCDIVDLQQDVSQGFAQSFSTNSCKVCFTPLALTDCDEVRWTINSLIATPVGTSVGNQTFCYTFPASGTYTVSMIVLRRRNDGTLCESFVFSQRVTVTCKERQACVASVFPNPDFEEGSVAGILGKDGKTKGWVRHWGDPHVDQKGGNKWTIQLSGNASQSDVLGTIEAVCLAKDTGSIRLRYGIKENGIKGVLSVQFFSSDVYEFGACDSASCYEVARIALPESANEAEEFDVIIPYNLTAWNTTALCNGRAQVRIRPAIFVSNPFRSGSPTVINLDYFCINGDETTSITTPGKALALQMYPNPTQSTFTLELPEPAKIGTSIRMLTLTGQVILDQEVETGSIQQRIDVGRLPAGMYLVQMKKAGQILGITKLVKQ